MTPSDINRLASQSPQSSWFVFLTSPLPVSRSYETGNGIKADESGKINNAGAENEALAVQGSYSYVGDDGQTYSVQYTADENGFQPQVSGWLINWSLRPTRARTRTR